MRPFAVAPSDSPVLDVLGQKLQIKVRGERTGGAYAVTEAEAAPGWTGAPPHIHHREDEAVYVLDGELTFTVDGEQLAAPAGTFIHVPRGSVHAFRNVASGPSRLLTIYTPSGFEGWFETASPADAATYGLEITPTARPSQPTGAPHP